MSDAAPHDGVRATAPRLAGIRIIHLLRSGLGLVATLALTFLGLLLVTFVIGRVIPIDPVLAVLGERATQAQYDAAREAMGLNEPIWWQFLLYVRDALSGDFGTSLLTAKPVLE
ncbi:MAG: ABC transporter permease, partial [Pseudomonadota bacterium]